MKAFLEKLHNNFTVSPRRGLLTSWPLIKELWGLRYEINRRELGGYELSDFASYEYNTK